MVKKDTNIPEKTGGEKLFDWGTYFGIGWLANAFISVKASQMSADGSARGPNENVVAYGIRKGLHTMRSSAVDVAQKGIDDIYQKGDAYEMRNAVIGNIPDQTLNGIEDAQTAFFNNYVDNNHSFDALATQLGKTPEQIQAVRDNMVGHQRWRTGAETFAATVALSAGGFALMIPIKLLEDHKLPITKHLDKVVDQVNEMTGQGFVSEYDKNKTMEKRQERYDHIASERKQSWSSVLTSRVLGAIPFYLAYPLLAKKDNIISGASAKISGHDYANPDAGFQGYEQHATQAITKGLDLAKEHIPHADQIIPTDAKARSHMEDTAFLYATDFSFAFLCAKLTYGLTRIFGPLIGQKQEIDPEPPSSSSQSTTTNSHVATVTANNSVNFSQDTPQSDIATETHQKEGGIEEKEPSKQSQKDLALA